MLTNALAAACAADDNGAMDPGDNPVAFFTQESAELRVVCDDILLRSVCCVFETARNSEQLSLSLCRSPET